MLNVLGIKNLLISPLHLLFVVNLQWLNDIENDPAYRSWPSGVQELLRATFPGVIRQIRRNFFNLVSLSKDQDYLQSKSTSTPIYSFVLFHSVELEFSPKLQQRIHLNLNC